MVDRLGEMEARVAALARELRWQRRATAGLALALGATFLGLPLAGAAAKQRELRAQRIVLVDGEGRARGALGVGADAGVRLELADADGRTRAALEAAADGTAALVFPAPGAAAGAAGAAGDAGPARARLAVSSAGEPRLELADRKGTPRLVAEIDLGEPRLKLVGVDGARSAGLAVSLNSPRLVLTDAAGRDRLWAALRLDSAVLQFLGEDGAARTGLTSFNSDAGVAVISEADGASPGLVLYGKKRNIVWSAP